MDNHTYNSNIKRYLDNIEENGIKEDEKLYSFLRTLTAISTGLLSLLISLKGDAKLDCIPKYLFLTTITLIALGILCSVIAQSYELKYFREKQKAWKEMLLEFVSDPSNTSLQKKDIPKQKIYRVCEKLTYILLGCSIVTLTSYSYVTL